MAERVYLWQRGLDYITWKQTKLQRTPPTKGFTKHTHHPHDEQTGAKDDEQAETGRDGITTKTIRGDTIGALRRGYHDAYRADYERTDNEAWGTTSTPNLRADDGHTDQQTDRRV